MIEHGNEPSLDEIGGWDGLAQAFMDDDVFNQTVQYISDDIESDDINSDAGQLLERLKGLKERYGSMSKMKKMSFTERVCQYIKNNYDIPDKMEFYIGTEGYDFEDWVDAYIEEYNNNVSSPFEDNADDSDVEAVGEEILQIMTAPYKTGNEYVINYDDFEASTKKMKKSDVKSQMPKSFTVDVGFEIPFEDYYDEGVWESGHNTDEEGNAIGIWLDGKDVWIGLQFFEDYDEVSYRICPIGSSTPIKEGSHNIDSVDGIIDGLEQFLINAGISEGEYGLEKSSKKMKKSIYDDNDWDNNEFYGDNNQRQRLLEYVKRTGTYKGSVPDGRGERQFYDMPDGYTVQFVIDIVTDAVTDVWRTKDFSEWDFPEIQKSQDIHSMIADIRKNNNSLKKSRVDLRFE